MQWEGGAREGKMRGRKRGNTWEKEKKKAEWKEKDNCKKMVLVLGDKLSF